MNESIFFFRRAFTLIVLFFFIDFIISVFLIIGLNKYYGFSQQPDILVNGSSIAMSGFNKEAIEAKTGLSISTYVSEGVGVKDRYAMVEHFFQLYPEGTKTVVYELNPVLLSNIKTAENVYTIFYPYLDDDAISKYVKENANKREFYISKIIRSKRFDPRLLRLILMGYFNVYDNLKINTLDTMAIMRESINVEEQLIVMEETSIRVFEETVEIIRNNKADVLLVMMPMYFSKLETFNKESYKELCNYFGEFASSYEDVRFVDLNQDSLITNPKYFSDPLHYNLYGQRRITEIIGGLLGEGNCKLRM